MGLANVPMDASIFGGSLRVLRKSEKVSEKTGKIANRELKICELFLKSTRLLPPRTFLGNRPEIEIYTNACGRSPFEKTSINWKSGIGIGWILVINDSVVEFFSLEVGEKSIRGNSG